jgi:hypothetical protein
MTGRPGGSRPALQRRREGIVQAIRAVPDKTLWKQKMSDDERALPVFAWEHRVTPL